MFQTVSQAVYITSEQLNILHAASSPVKEIVDVRGKVIDVGTSIQELK
jgi:hypothetical protein